jgi:hypothetical protein
MINSLLSSTLCNQNRVIAREFDANMCIQLYNAMSKLKCRIAAQVLCRHHADFAQGSDWRSEGTKCSDVAKPVVK